MPIARAWEDERGLRFTPQAGRQEPQESAAESPQPSRSRARSPAAGCAAPPYGMPRRQSAAKVKAATRRK